ncbi:MAG: D-glycero-beta-D-manno-heptose-7-phosphate kinase [Rhodocyclaceae bacterium]|nr:D-glycero-beta-D-manno-heptose-7-phosphate kinase [Rhodocyclaceae bacterium]MBP7081116.1 D-glycero-beta-D-manno-heptose-7-phosphate kinase [Rhodocyclaceae bacterium]
MSAKQRHIVSIPDTSKARILVVGDVMLDRYWFGDASRISPEAPVPVVKVEKTEERPGGAANVAQNCADLGASVALLSVVGADDAGRSLSRLMVNSRVDASFHEDPSLNTTVKLRVIARQQQLLRIDFENSPDHEVLQAKLEEFAVRVIACDVVILSDYGKGGLTHLTEMIRLARSAGKPVLVDPKGEDYSRYIGATLLTPNRSELRQVVGRWKDEAELVAKANQLRTDLNLEALLVTRSEEGMSLFAAHGSEHEAALAREVFDVSGAGDTVIATVAVMLASGETLPNAMRLANRAAGIVVGKLGTATCSIEELRNA